MAPLSVTEVWLMGQTVMVCSSVIPFWGNAKLAKLAMPVKMVAWTLLWFTCEANEKGETSEKMHTSTSSAKLTCFLTGLTLMGLGISIIRGRITGREPPRVQARCLAWSIAAHSDRYVGSCTIVCNHLSTRGCASTSWHDGPWAISSKQILAGPSQNRAFLLYW